MSPSNVPAPSKPAPEAPRGPLSPAEAAGKGPIAPLSPAEAAAGGKSPSAAPLSPAELAEKEKADQGKREPGADPDAPADVSNLALKEPPPKTIGEGFEKRTLRKLTPEEKDARRARWNFVMAVIGVIVLISVAMLMMGR